MLKALDTLGADVTAGELARYVSLSPATVTGIIKRLERKELVERVRDDADKRRVRVHVTAAGRGVLERVPSLLQDYFIDSFSQLQDWEQSLLLSSLQRVAEMMSCPEIVPADKLEKEDEPLEASLHAQFTPEVLDSGVFADSGDR
jgi:DNA-binding MarR family transcriptional regulator